MLPILIYTRHVLEIHTNKKKQRLKTEQVVDHGGFDRQIPPSQSKSLVMVRLSGEGKKSKQRNVAVFFGRK